MSINSIWAIILILVIGGISLIFLVLTKHFYRKSQILVRKNPQESSNYSKSVIIGVVSGLVVLVLDRIITTSLQKIPQIDASSIYSLVGSIISIIIVACFIVSLILVLISYTLYHGLKNIVRTK
jgi:hypothetical protein